MLFRRAMRELGRLHCVFRITSMTSELFHFTVSAAALRRATVANLYAITLIRFQLNEPKWWWPLFCNRAKQKPNWYSEDMRKWSEWEKRIWFARQQVNLISGNNEDNLSKKMQNRTFECSWCDERYFRFYLYVCICIVETFVITKQFGHLTIRQHIAYPSFCWWSRRHFHQKWDHVAKWCQSFYEYEQVKWCLCWAFVNLNEKNSFMASSF